MPSKHPETPRGLQVLSQDVGSPAIDLAALALPLTVLDHVGEDVARRLRVLPLRVDHGCLFVAATDPNDAAVLDEIAFLSGKRVVAYAAHPDQIDWVVDEAYGARRRGEVVWLGPKAPPTTPSDIAALPLDELHGDAVQPPPRSGEPPAMREPFSGEAYEGSDIGDAGVARPRPRILVVDDEPVIRRIVHHALLQRGYEVLEAADGVEALRRIKAHEPDAILLDAMLPDVHGFDICKRLKASRRYAHIPILMMTAVYKGWRMAADLKESYGVAATIEKPFNLQEVVRLLEQALTGRAAEAPDHENLSVEARRFYNEGAAAYRRNELDTALASLNAAVQIDPLSPTLRHQLGLLYAKRGHDFAAIQELEAAVDLDPGRFQTLRNLAVLYQRHGFRRKACELWERGLAHAPDEPTRQEIKALLVKLL